MGTLLKFRSTTVSVMRSCRVYICHQLIGNRLEASTLQPDLSRQIRAICLHILQTVAKVLRPSWDGRTSVETQGRPVGPPSSTRWRQAPIPAVGLDRPGSIRGKRSKTCKEPPHENLRGGRRCDRRAFGGEARTGRRRGERRRARGAARGDPEPRPDADRRRRDVHRKSFLRAIGSPSFHRKTSSCSPSRPISSRPSFPSSRPSSARTLWF